MKRFLIVCLIILAAIVSILSIFEYTIRQQPNVYQYKNDYIIQNGQEIETLILGSSHAYYGIQPSAFDSTKAFNLANVSQNLKYDNFLLSKYAPYCPNLKNVIVPISYFSLFAKESGGDEWWREIGYKIYMDAPFYSDFSKYNFEISNYSNYKRKILRLVKDLIRNEQKLVCDSLGFGTDYALNSKKANWDSPKASQAAVNRHTYQNWQHLADNISYLDHILSFSSQEKIHVILLTTPTWHTYYERLDTLQLHKMEEVLKEFTNKFPNVTYSNYLKDNRFIEEDFYDCDHLSNIGAEKFTIILERENIIN